MRPINIHEAVKESIRTGKMMVREDSPFYKKGKSEIRINPTDGPDCCVIHVFKNGKEVRRQRCWNPQAADLISEEWALVD